MSTLREVVTAARELERAFESVNALQAEKGKLQVALADVNDRLDAARTDRDAKAAAFKTLVSELV